MVSTILFHKLYDYLILYNNLGLILQNIVIFVNIFVTFLYYSDIIIPCVLQSHIIIFQICLTTLLPKIIEANMYNPLRLSIKYM